MKESDMRYGAVFKDEADGEVVMFVGQVRLRDNVDCVLLQIGSPTLMQVGSVVWRDFRAYGPDNPSRWVKVRDVAE